MLLYENMFFFRFYDRISCQAIIKFRMFLTKYLCFANFRFKQQANALIGIMIPNFEIIDILVCVGSMVLQND